MRALYNITHISFSFFFHFFQENKIRRGLWREKRTIWEPCITSHISHFLSFFVFLEKKRKFTIHIFFPFCFDLEFLPISCSLLSNFKAKILSVCSREIISSKTVDLIEKYWKLCCSVYLFCTTFKWSSKLFIWDKCIKDKQLPETILS